MRRTTGQFLSATIAGLLLVLTSFRPGIVMADTADAPSLVISQLKITSSNGQFITLYNATGAALDMSRYQLEYFNNYDLGKATSSKLIALSGSLPPHGYYMVNDSSLLLCYQLMVDSVSLGLSSTAGFVEVLAFDQASPGAAVAPRLQDYVGWSKTAAAGAQTLSSNTAAFLQRQPLDNQNNPLIKIAGSGSWRSVQADPANACGLVTASGPVTPVQSGLSQLLPATEPPVTILVGTEDSPATPTASLPSSDIGLMAPQITEILPNPIGTGNDATDEFVELYNPNNTAFDLSGFSLQAGLTTLHTYSFPAGASLPGQSFTAFYAANTGLSFSNSGSQAKLLDPFGNAISSTDAYGTAKDGQAWARANGKWLWTTQPTPGAANVINAPVSTKKATKSTTAKSSKPAAEVGTAKKTVGNAGSGANQDVLPKTPVHLGALALIATVALIYGAYEYRADIANRFHQFKRYLKAGGDDRLPLAGRRGNRTGKRSRRWQNALRTRLGRRHGQFGSGDQPQLHAEQPVQGGKTDPASL